MADFRRWFTVLAVIAVVAFAASAQVGTITPPASANSALLCSATGAGIPALRPEGYTELIGDILISCQGGPTMAQGAAIPTTNITIYMSPSVPVTSRFLSPNGASEALLIIDEAGSTNISTGATGGWGPQAVQKLCSYVDQTTVPTPCAAHVGQDTSGAYEVALGTDNTSARNVFQGKVGDLGPQTVTFYNVPVLPPATTGVSRVFRITNIRIPAVGYVSPASFTAVVSTSPNQTLPVAGTAINVGIVGTPMTAAVVPASNAFQQCLPQNQAQTATLLFSEGFGTAFKTRVVPGGIANGTPGAVTDTLYAAENTNTVFAPNNQNIPGGLYGGFAANSESGFIFPALNAGVTSSSGVNWVAGLADYGTRLKAVFTNIPSGLTLYVSNTSIPYLCAKNTNCNTTNPDVIGGTSTAPFAVLVATNSGEANADSTNNSTFTPLGTSGNTALSANAQGQAIAVWEVTNASQIKDVLAFGVYISYTASSATTANPYGLPITDLPLLAPANNVALSFAPEPGGGTFTTANATAGSNPIPRFAIINPYSGRWTTINLCQTTLLYPFVTGASRLRIPRWIRSALRPRRALANYMATGNQLPLPATLRFRRRCRIAT